MNWREFVKGVQKKHGISYKEAMQKASPLWKEHKTKQPKATKRKAKAKKKLVEAHIEVNEFPKPDHKNKPSRKLVPVTDVVRHTNIGGSIIPQDDRTTKKVKSKGRKRLRKKHSILYTAEAKYLARKSGI